TRGEDRRPGQQDPPAARSRPERAGLDRGKGTGPLHGGIEGGGGGETERQRQPEAAGAEGGGDDRDGAERQERRRGGPPPPGEGVGHRDGEPQATHHRQDELRPGGGGDDGRPERFGRPARRPPQRRDGGRGRQAVGGVAAGALGQEDGEAAGVGGDGHRRPPPGGEGADPARPGDGGRHRHQPAGVAEQPAAAGGGHGRHDRQR